MRLPSNDINCYYQNMKQQVLIIHGGTSFRNNKSYIEYLKNKSVDLDRFRYKPNWKETLAADLGDDYDVLFPKMPNGMNAQYSEWKIWFDKILELTDKNIILIGHSLGGIFLAKYLSENQINKNLVATILVAAPIRSTSDEDLASFELKKSLRKLDEQSNGIFIVHAEDDPVVPVNHARQFKKLLSNAKLMILPSGEHFKIEHFPEIVEIINKL